MNDDEQDDDDRFDDEEFRRAMAGIVPLGEKVRMVSTRRRARAAQPPREPGGRFEVESWGEQIEGLRQGGDRRQLRRLQRGEVPVDLRLDLHGSPEASARQAVESAVESAHARGQRCLLVIHGRGRNSPAGPVLKEALPDWLTGPRCGARVLAFCSAPAWLGGTGATLVLLLRRKTKRKTGSL